MSSLTAVLAQIVPDQTLPDNSQVEAGCTRCLIEGGTIRGSNLFHSFREFSLPTGSEAWFNHATTIQNILARVTGNGISHIDGLLKTNGSANLFLLNPNGIVFGNNARLEVAGSFVASTASRLVFADGSEFSAIAPQAPPLLTVNLTPGLQYGTSSANATIVNQGHLTVGQDLTLQADRLELQGQLRAGRDLTLQAQTTVQVRDAVTTPFLAQAGANLTVQGNQGIDILALNHLPQPAFVSGGHLSLISDGVISGDAHFASGGRFQVNSLSNSLANFTSLHDPIVSSGGDIDVTGNYTGASLLVESLGNIRFSGAITITERDTAITPIDADTTLLANSRALIVRSGRDRLMYAPNVPIGVNGSTAQVGSNLPTGITLLGDVRADAGTIVLAAANGNVNARNLSTGGFGNIGGVQITANGNINATSVVSLALNGNGGEINLAANNGSIVTTGEVNAFSLRNGNAGDVRMTATTGITTPNINTFALNGLGGDVTLSTNTGDITTGVINAWSRNFAQGQSGTIQVTTNDGNITTGILNTTAEDFDQGSSGDIQVTTNNGNITTGTINAKAEDFNQGSGGNITLTTLQGHIRTRDVEATADSERPGNGGNGGNITLRADRGSVTSGKLESLGFTSSGSGGTIQVTAGQGITASQVNTFSTASVGTQGHGGTINLFSDRGTIAIPGQIFSFANRAGNGGSITVRTNDGDILTNRLFMSSTTDGNGGDISLFAQNGRIYSPDGVITWTTNGDGGNVNLFATHDINTITILTRTLAGNGGNVTVTSPQGRLVTQAINTSAVQNAGDVTIATPSQPFTLAGFIDSQSFLNGNSGDIQITAQGIELRNAVLSTSVSGVGNAGRITLNTSGDIQLNASRLFTALDPESVGRGGDVTINTRSLQLNNLSTIDTATSGQGDAGNVRITADTIALDRSTIFSITAGQGRGGNVSLAATQAVRLTNRSNISTAVDTGAIGDGGDVQIQARSLSVSGGSQLQALTRGTGNSGNIQLTAPDIQLSGIGTDGFLSGVFTASEVGSRGRGGNITVNADHLRVADGAVLNAQTSSAFPGGEITVNANTVELQTGGQLLTNTFGSGAAGNITVNAAQQMTIAGADPNFTNRVTPQIRQNFPVLPPRTISAVEPNNSLRQAQAIDAFFALNPANNSNANVEYASRVPYVSIVRPRTNQATVDYYAVTVDAAGARGTVDIDTGNAANRSNTVIRLFDSNGTLIASNNSASAALGAAGSINDVSGGFTRDAYLRYVFGAPGTYYIQVSQLGFDDFDEEIPGRNIANLPRPQGTRNPYTLQVSLQTPNVSGSVISSSPASGLLAQTQGSGAAGNVIVNTPELNMLQGGRILASTESADPSGVGGNAMINSSQVQLIDGSTISAGTSGAAPGGNLTLRPYGNQPDLTLTLRDRSQISTSTSGSGTGGTLTLTAPRSLTVQGQGSIAAGTTGGGSGGAVRLNSDRVQLRDQAVLSATTTDRGTGGTISVNANEFRASDRGQLRTTTSGSGQAGNIRLYIRDDLTLTGRGTGLFANTEPGSIGDSGSIFIDPQRVFIQHGAGVAVDSQGRGRGGNLEIQAGQLRLENQGFLTAETASAQGGNIAINVRDVLVLRRNSLISATAGTAQGGGDGGNITIVAPFVLGVLSENSDIVANAFTGRGGNINITTNGIFGLRFQPQLTPNSDITASSQFGISGTVTLNLLAIDPSQGLVSLPINLVDPTNQISQTCVPGRGKTASSFVTTGRGGLPQTPDQPLRHPAIVTPWVTLSPPPTSQSPSSPSSSPSPSSASPSPILEAQHWLTAPDGTIHLVSQATQGTPTGLGVVPMACPEL